LKELEGRGRGMTGAECSATFHRPIARRRGSDAGIVVLLFPLVLGCATAWALRDELDLTPETGLGYGLGVAGFAMMALLLLYSPRKRLRALHSWGPLARWFRWHMALGLLGPTAILLHANFRLGSSNSTVALCSMLLVAASGVAGRFIYARIHHGLYGRRVSLEEIRRELSASQEHPDAAGAESNATRASRLVEDHARAVRRVAEFQMYERLFSAWHVAHLPLCFLLFAAGAVHILAVHLY